MANSKVKEILSGFVSLIYPNPCRACQNSLVMGEEVVCTNCMLEMPQTGYHLIPGNMLQERLSYRFPIKYAMALFRFSKQGRVQQLLHALKYDNHPEVGEVFGRLYGSKMQETDFYGSFDSIVPVPLHPVRQLRRGYNQSSKFAQGLSEKLEIPTLDDVLERTLITTTQTQKSKLSRWKNMSGAFQLKNPAPIIDQHILLADDVITTGSTIEACALELLAGGCRTVSVVCIAVA